MDWSGVDYLWSIVMFLSAAWTLILTAPIHCRGSNGEQVMQCYISTNLSPWRNKLIYILDGLRPESKFSAYFLFWVNYSFNLLSAPNKLLCYLNNCFYFSSHSLMWISHNQRVQLDRPRQCFMLIWIPNTFSLTLCQTGGKEFGRHQPERCSLLLIWPESSCSLLWNYKTQQKGQDQQTLFTVVLGKWNVHFPFLL